MDDPHNNIEPFKIFPKIAGMGKRIFQKIYSTFHFMIFRKFKVLSCYPYRAYNLQLFNISKTQSLQCTWEIEKPTVKIMQESITLLNYQEEIFLSCYSLNQP